MKNDCKIIQDLLPNYIEKVTSQDTNEYIEEHLKKCNECTKVYNDMNYTIKEDVLDEKKEVDFMKKFNKEIKKLKLSKFILMVIGIIVIILLGIIAYRYSILNRISKKDINDVSNIYYNAESNKQFTEYWKKDGIVKQKIKSKDNNGDLTFWFNTNNGESIVINEQAKTYSKLNGTFIVVPNSIANIDTFKDRLMMAINPTVTIETRKYNNKDCYYIKFLDGLVEEIFDKETGLLVYESGHSVFEKNSEVLDNNEVIYKYKIDVTEDKDIMKPNLNEYKLKND